MNSLPEAHNAEERNPANNPQETISKPTFSIGDLINSCVHFGHRTGARDSKMKRYILKESNGIHIIDVRKTYYHLEKAINFLMESAKQEKRILFVSTNERFAEVVADLAKKCGQHYVTKWRGGMLTNWRSVVSSIKKLKKQTSTLSSYESNKDTEHSIMTKKEYQKMLTETNKLQASFGGIIGMGGMPDVVVTFSVKDEKLAIMEAACLGVPVVGIVDTNANFDNVSHPIPGNDDSLRSISFYSDIFAKAIIAGTKRWVKNISENESETKLQKYSNRN